jgi:hypothetical protein
MQLLEICHVGGAAAAAAAAAFLTVADIIMKISSSSSLADVEAVHSMHDPSALKKY